MKDYILGLVLAVVLMFSFNSTEFTPTGRSGTQQQGETGLIVLGGGTEIVEVVTIQTQETVKNESPDVKTKEAKEEIPLEIIVEEVKEQGMNDMLLMFWHGVAAVLIGETSILVAVTVWLKIKLFLERKDGKAGGGLR